MDRDQARELFSAYRDEELEADQLASLEKLLEEDDECRSEYEAFCRVLDGLAALAAEPAPVGFSDKVKGKLKRRSGGRFFGGSPFGTMPRIPYEIFSLVLILIILTVYLLTISVSQVGSPSSSGDDEERGSTPEEVE